MMKRPLHILHLEDDPLDAELIQATLGREGIPCEVLVVASRDQFVAALNGGVDVILADFALPGFDGMEALKLARQARPDLPFVFVSGRLGEEAAIESLKNGATDYVLKNRLCRLAPALNRALQEAQVRSERQHAEAELARANREIRERAESYQNLFASIRDVIVVTGPQRQVLQVNQPALREVFGYETEELAGKHARLLFADEEEVRRTTQVLAGLQPSGRGELLEVVFRRKNGELFSGELYVQLRLDSEGAATGHIGIIRDVNERKQAEAALRESELRRYQLQVELVYAAEVQTKLLPRNYPQIPGFDVAAQCLPARQVGGDFFDWQEVCPGVWGFTLGDVMGKGMAAAMLMATVRASLRSVAHNPPAEALRLAEQALSSDLDSSESFVTLFYTQLWAEARRLTFVDCGHGYVFLRRADGRLEDFSLRALPLGVPGSTGFQEGTVEFEPGDTLVLYSDGLVDARPELELDNRTLAAQLEGTSNAQEMVGRLFGLTEQQGPRPDDITVLVVRCND